MERVPRGRYTKEFREEAVKLVTEEKLSVPEAGRRLNIAPQTNQQANSRFSRTNLMSSGSGWLRPMGRLLLHHKATRARKARWTGLNPSLQMLKMQPWKT